MKTFEKVQTHLGKADFDLNIVIVLQIDEQKKKD